jgi:hypothetical protein
VRIGYARVSTQDQNLNLQKDVLKRAGCEKIVSTSPAARVKHGGLGKLRELMRKGDVVAGLAWALADVVQVVLGDFDLTLYKVCIPVALHRICHAHLAVPSFKPSLASRKGCGPGGAWRD